MVEVVREAILRGIGGAAEAHDAFRFRQRHEDGLRAIDVFGVIAELKLPLAFQALDELLGACIRVSSSEVGILVTSQRDLHMQRFTAAHELGHFVLEHEGSLDREIRLPGDTKGRDPREIEADAFAAEFLMPKWLVKAAAQRRHWWGDDLLRIPEVVYQLSLRLAVSYEATCWGLAAHDFVRRDVARALTVKKLKDVKKKVLRGVPLGDPWADVWQLGSGDDGAQLDAGPNDLFVFELAERAASGFRWDVQSAIDTGFALLADTSEFDERVVGGQSERRLVLSAPPPGTYELHLPLRRSFEATPANGTAFSISICTIGTRRDEYPAEFSTAVSTVH